MNEISTRLNGSELQVLALIAKYKDISKSDISESLSDKVSQRTLLSSLRVLEVIGAITMQRGKKTFYRATNTGKEILINRQN